MGDTEIKDEVILSENEIPGTAKIRKLGAALSSMELLKLSATLAADIPAELKLQTFTSFRLPEQFVPDIDTCVALINGCDSKRANIAAYFIVDYNLEIAVYDCYKGNMSIVSILIKALPEDRLIDLYAHMFGKESKEYITGAIRLVVKEKRRFRYRDINKIRELTNLAFEAKEVFFTSKLLFCQAFNVPEEVVSSLPHLEKILKISINYEEKITKEFIEKYNLSFESSDLAMCKYYLGNKKATNQKSLVGKFAAHLVRIEDPRDRSYLLRGAFKRGGYFRMYAGCMQDGYIDMNKMQRFHYSDEDVAWCSKLPGLRK